jgi:hypothetical protein
MLTPPRTIGFSYSRVELPLLTHPWLLTYTRVTCCLARAHAYGIESSRLPVEHSRSHPRTHQSNSTRTSGSCNFAADLVLRVEPALRCSCLDFRTDEGSSPCVAPPSSLHPVAISALPPFLPARRSSCISRASELASSLSICLPSSGVLHLWRCPRLATASFPCLLASAPA